MMTEGRLLKKITMRDVMATATLITTPRIPFNRTEGEGHVSDPVTKLMQVAVIVSRTNNFICYIKCPPASSLTNQQQQQQGRPEQ